MIQRFCLLNTKPKIQDLTGSSTYSISGCFSDQYSFINCDEHNSENCIKKNKELIYRISNHHKSTKLLDFKLTVDESLNSKEISIFYRESGNNHDSNNTLTFTTEELKDCRVRVLLETPLSLKLLDILKELNKSTPIRELYINDPDLTKKNLIKFFEGLRKLKVFGNGVTNTKLKENFSKKVNLINNTMKIFHKKLPARFLINNHTFFF